MHLKGKLFTFMFALFIFFSFCVWSYSEILFSKINEKWAERFIRKQIVFDKNRTLLPLLNEIEIIQEMIKEPDLLAMALDDTNEAKRQKGLAILEVYRQKFQSKSYFAAFVKSENYYFNDAKNSYAGKELQYKLSASRSNDAWFYAVLSDNKAYQINVDTDEALGNTYVWLNHDIKVNDKVVGIVGTGMDFTRFVRESVGIEQEGVRNFFINRYMDIQFERGTKFNTYTSLQKADGSHRKIDTLFLQQKDREAINEAIHYLSAHPDDIRTFWVEYDGRKKLLGVSYLKEVDWFSLTLIDDKELEVIKDFSILPMLSILFLVALIAVSIELHSLILDPLKKLKLSMRKIQSGNYEVDLKPVGTAEIEELSKQFIAMIEYVRANNIALEEIVQERTKGLLQSEAKLNTILDSVEAYIYIKDAQYRYLYANKKTCDLFGVALGELIGHEDHEFFDEKTAKNIRKVDSEVIEYARKVTLEETNTDKQTGISTTYLSTKMPLSNDDGSIYALCGISTDITERKKTEELIKELAFHDALTHLPNRRMFDERFTFLLAHAKRSHQWGALLVIDLDNFKPLNDAFGHKAGDLLLTDVAARLNACVRQSDIVARFGGDEFIVALSDLGKDEDGAKVEAMKVASKILFHVRAPYVLLLDEEGNDKMITHECTASIGVTLFGYDKQNKEHIFSEADKAMYCAKQKGRNCIEFSKE
ncbi:GGDEF domain-containing protein [Sulfurospirillum sp. UCH001]|uniref:GGDEF domain-containing protein n=1 Tax=Sulfurospirillum sp. UCH001 TaxID=1581011 RepID=UPI0008371382|nr:GGDEF domain-containing protein [Sulfurospirillum sp. UCH001]